MNNPQGGFFIRRSQSLGNALFQHLALFEHFSQLRRCTVAGVLLEHSPIGIKGNQPWLIGGHIALQPAAHFITDRIQGLPFFDHDRLLKDFQISGVDGE